MVHKKVGTKAEVFHGLAQHTAGKLTKKDLTVNAKGHVVSAKKHAIGVKNYAHTLAGHHPMPKAHKKGGAMLGGYLL